MYQSKRYQNYPIKSQKVQELCLRFKSDLFHPNIYPDGRVREIVVFHWNISIKLGILMTSQVCISILHPPGADPLGYESSSERWSPVQSIEKILLSGVESLWTVFEQFNFQFVTLDLSVMSMLAEPNTESPANVDAAKMWREDRSFDHV